MKIDMYTLKECIKAWLKRFFKIFTGRGHFDPSLMERVKSCYQEDGGHYKHLLKRSWTFKKIFQIVVLLFFSSILQILNILKTDEVISVSKLTLNDLSAGAISLVTNFDFLHETGVKIPPFRPNKKNPFHRAFTYFMRDVHIDFYPNWTITFWITRFWPNGTELQLQSFWSNLDVCEKLSQLSQ